MKSGSSGRRPEGRLIFDPRALTMRPAALDRLMFTWIAAALVVWVACLVVVWGEALDTSGATSILTLAAVFLAVSAAAPLPGRLARGFQRLLIWLGLLDVARMELSMAAPVMSRQSDALTALRMLGLAAVFAVACGAASTLLIFVAGELVVWLAARMLLRPLAWSLLKIAFVAIGMLPIALAACVVFLVGAIVRGGTGKDSYASAFREWLWATAGGSLVFGLAWFVGADLRGLIVLCGVGLLLAAGWLAARGKKEVRTYRRRRAIEVRPGRRVKLTVAFSFAAAAIVWALQARLLTDVAGAGTGLCACWTALSIAMLAAAMRRVDRKPRPPAKAQGIGAAIGVVAAVLLQSALAVMCLRGRAASVVYAALAAAAQVPLAACGAIVLSRQRRLFAGAGARPRAYLCWSCRGAACGLIAFALIGWSRISAVWLLGLATAVIAAATVAAIAAARGASAQARWAGCGVALAAGLAAVSVLSINQAREATGPATAGAWLTSFSGAGEPGTVQGFLPLSPRPAKRDDRVRDFLESVLRRRGGLWWIVGGSARDLPNEMPRGVVAVVSYPDESACGLRGRAGSGYDRRLRRRGVSGGYFAPASAGLRRFDGILITSMPADHPHAWRVYNTAALGRCLSQLNPKDGLLAIRTRARGGRLGSALAVVATFQRVVGSSLVVMDLGADQVDLVVVGPAREVGKLEPPESLYAISGRELLDRAPAGPVRVTSPRMGRLFGDPGIEQLRMRLGPPVRAGGAATRAATTQAASSGTGPPRARSR